MPPSDSSRQRVAFAELSAGDRDLLIQYWRHPGWEVAGAWSADPKSWSVSMAGSLGIPIPATLQALVSLGCDRIVVGARGDELLEQLTTSVASTGTEVWDAGRALADITPADQGGEKLPWLDPERTSFDSSRGDLDGFLRLTCRRLKADSASLAVIDRDGLAVRLIAWHGLSQENAANPRKRLECAAGRTLLGMGPQLAQASFIPSPEDDARPSEMAHLSLPILSGGRILASLNLSIPGKLDLNLNDPPRELRDVLSQTEYHLLKSVETHSLDLEERRQFLLHGIDLAMSLDESLPERLRAAGEFLMLHLNAAANYVYLTDLSGEKLQNISSASGTGSLGARFQPLGGGLLGWAAGLGSTCLMVPYADTAVATGRQGLCLMPLANENRTVGMIVVEGIPVAQPDEEMLNGILIEVSGLINEMLLVEQGLGEHDAYGQIRIRFTEIIQSIDQLDDSARIPATLDAAVELLAAEAVIWTSSMDRSPVLPGSLNSQMLESIAAFLPDAKRITARIRENGRSWHLPVDTGQDQLTSLHYAGVAHADGDGVLIALFAKDVVTGSQLTTSTILEVLYSICEQIRGIDDQPGTATTGTPETRQNLSAADIQRRITEEWYRSVRFGHGFSISRIQLAANDASPENSKLLRDFMHRVQRDVDFACEQSPGVFCLLSPETERFPEGLSFRLQQVWRSEPTEARLIIDQMCYPRDGQSRKAYHEFATGVGTSVEPPEDRLAA